MSIATWEFESPPLHNTRGNSSVGRAQPCQGWGREFESRFPLFFTEGNRAIVRMAASFVFLLLMNIYARYFDQDVLVHGVDELMDFLSSIPEIPINQRLVDDVRAYVESDMPYPKRYKIRPRVYFILIKTSAETMEEFKSHRKDEEVGAGEMSSKISEPLINKKEIKAAQLAEEREGWYLVTMLFKRVIQIAATAKFRYQDTTFQAYIRAKSGNECFNRMIEHLKNRPEVDLRSQFPSAKGANFTFEYIGETLPGAEA